MKFQQQKLITVKEKEINFAETKYGAKRVDDSKVNA